MLDLIGAFLALGIANKASLTAMGCEMSFSITKTHVFFEFLQFSNKYFYLTIFKILMCS